MIETDDSPFVSHSTGQIRFDLSAELVALDATSLSSYEVCSNETDLSALSPHEQNSHLHTLIDRLALIGPDQLPRERELWDDLRTFLKYFHSLDDATHSKVADGIVSSLSQLGQMLKRDIQAAARTSLQRTGTTLDGDSDSDDDRHSANTPEELRRTYCQAIEMWAFLANWLIYVGEKAAHSLASAGGATATSAAKAKGRGKKTAGTGPQASGTNFPWTATILPALLSEISNFLTVLPSTLLWPLSTPRDALMSTLLRPSLQLLERESNLKTVADIKAKVFAITGLAVKSHGQLQTAQTMLLQMLQYYEHLPESVAQLLTCMRVEHGTAKLAEEMLVEIASREFGSAGNAGPGASSTFAMTASQENKTPRVFSRFLVSFTEQNARTTLKMISLLRKLIDSEAYPIRNAMVEVFYLLLRDLVMSDEEVVPAETQEDADTTVRETSAESKQRQIESFWDLLFERFLDVNSYVRVKVLQICTRICDLPAKFPAQRTKLLALAQQSLKDKSSSARKACVTLLTRLILTHPYGLMHGGELEESAWQTRTEEVRKQMEALGGGISLPVAEEEASEGEDEGEDEGEEDGDEDDDDGDQGDQDRNRSQDEDTSVIQKKEKKQTRKSNGRKSINSAQLLSQLSPQDVETLNRLKLTHRYYSDALTFIQSLSSSMPTLEELLYSASKAEALEAMDFFRVAAEYKLPGAERGMRKMIHLVWTKDNAMVEPAAGGVTGAAGAEERETGPSTTRSIKGRLIEVYSSLYFSPLAHLNHKENAGLIARNLVERTQGASLAELTSLEELLSTMSGDNMISEYVVDRLWAVYATPSARKIERSQRRGAIIVLSMLAAAKRQIVHDKIDVLLAVGLGPLGNADLVLAKWSVVALGRVGGSAKKVKGALSDQRVRFPMSHPMFAKLRSTIVSSGLAGRVGGEASRGQWFSLAENCVQVIYELGEQPDRLCGDLIRWFMAQVFAANPDKAEKSPLKEQRQSSTGPEESQASGKPSPAHPALAQTASAFQLAQLIFLVGHVALKQIIYLEVVEREYKRRKAEAERAVKGDKEQAASKGDGASSVRSTQAGKKGSKKGAEKSGNKENEPEDGDELEQVAGNVEDEIGEVIGEVREKELLYGGRSLLALFGPLVVHMASNPKSYAPDHLRKAVVLTLCKFMCVSSTFCEANFSLLLHILATSSDPATRSNVVIALGDIAVSFGTIIDENSDRLYAGLNDRDLGVKKHTLMVLTHLILNGMIKVKGQLGEMAKCLEDPEARVSDLAKLFFSELATKENAVYNNLPDIISHLSVGKHAVDEETFERTMRFIFNFVDKEKQAENVIDKLCQRFRLTSAERQWRDIAFCLSLLPYKSERSVKKLIDGLPFYQDKLHDETVYRRFVEIVAKARSARGTGGAAAKAASAVGGGGEAELQDFEQLIEGFHTKGEEEAQLEVGTAAKVAKAQAALARGGGAAGRGGRGGAGARGRGRGGSSRKTSGGGSRRRTPDSDGSDGDGGSNDSGGDEVDAAPAPAPAVAATRKRGAVAASKAAPPAAAPARMRATRGAPTRKRVVASSDDDDDDSF